MIRSHLSWPVIIVASAIGAGVVTFTDVSHPIRHVLVLWFLFICPGMSYLRLLAINDRLAEWTLAVALSFAIDATVAMIMLYAGLWSTSGGFAAIVALSLIGAVLQLRQNGLIKARRMG